MLHNLEVELHAVVLAVEGSDAYGVDLQTCFTGAGTGDCNDSVGATRLHLQALDGEGHDSGTLDVAAWEPTAFFELWELVLNVPRCPEPFEFLFLATHELPRDFGHLAGWNIGRLRSLVLVFLELV